MSNVIEFRPRVTIGRSRNREKAIGQLIPKMFGIIRDNGEQLHGFGGCSAKLNGEVIVTGFHIDQTRIGLSVYAPIKLSLMKVFSCHVALNKSHVESEFYRYWNGHVGLMSWRRGVWEDIVMAEHAAIGSLTEAFFCGYFRANEKVR